MDGHLISSEHQAQNMLARMCVALSSKAVALMPSMLAGLARVSYATSFTPGPCKVRPFQLGYRSDFGFASIAEPEDLEMLLQLVLVEGCRDSSLHDF